jgi:hypothetical protein
VRTPRLVLERAGATVKVPLDGAPEKVAILDETALVAFRVESPETGAEYRLLIGTEPVDVGWHDVDRHDEQHAVEWPAAPYLESARGPTLVRVESRAGEGDWRPRGGLILDVVPSKLGEEQYRALFHELRAISPALVYDVQGKSGRITGITADDIAASWQRAEKLVRRVAQVSSVAAPRQLRPRPHRDERRTQALRCALDPARAAGIRQVATLLETLERSLDRIRRDTAAATEDIRRGGLQLRTSSRARSLYDMLDAPRLSRVQVVHDTARALLADVRHVRTSEPYSRARPLPGVSSGSGGAGLAGRAVFALRHTVAAGRRAESGGSYVRPTSRLYEQWAFLRLVRAFARLARSTEPLQQLIDALGRQGFAALQRGTTVELPLDFTSATRVTLRYEPIIRPRALALPADPFARAHAASGAPLVPDIVISVTAKGGLRSFVLDAKYTRSPRAESWAGVERYFSIRNATTNRSAVDEVWIIAPVRTMPDASGNAGPPPPDGWRGGLLPLVPGSTVPHAWLRADAEPHTFGTLESRAGSSGRHAHAEDGTTVALRAFVARLLFRG